MISFILKKSFSQLSRDQDDRFSYMKKQDQHIRIDWISATVGFIFLCIIGGIFLYASVSMIGKIQKRLASSRNNTHIASQSASLVDSATPSATLPPTETPLPTETPTPTLSPTPTPIPFEAYIDGVLYVDNNYNDIRESYEKGLMGQDIIIWDIDSGSHTIRVTTNDDGYYKAIIQYPGRYQPQTGDLNLKYQYPVTVVLEMTTSGETKRRDFAMIPLGKRNQEIVNEGVINGFVFEDKNQNGIKDGGEGGIHFYKINLSNASTNTSVGSISSEENGNFTFKNLPLGLYRIEAYNPTGDYTITKSEATVELNSGHTIDSSARLGVKRNK